ncbi:NH3-dependent NAD+ synthetase [Pseudomonas syringae pv. actinidiae]|uniref:NH3-dependent NAD+ synthetase n=1 Tax=Pseudomonas syringae pv. actinidiae TaxID=103796 RepID=A0A2V0Q9J9_PSESF|nr:NH3-dependent NAD+ synthetase [Pseudomonas syringae pv. actinidiae]
MPDWPMAKICASSSTPNESLLSARSTFSRKGSPPALHNAERSSQASWRMAGTRRFMVAQSKERS